MQIRFVRTAGAPDRVYVRRGDGSETSWSFPTYGDAVPQSHLGRLLAGMVMICGVGVFGLWTGILATGFAAESRRQNFLKTWDLVSKVPFFQSLDPAAITEITHLLRLLEVPERTSIIRRGKIGDCMYFIAAGEVQVDVKPSPVRLGTVSELARPES